MTINHDANEHRKKSIENIRVKVPQFGAIAFIYSVLHLDGLFRQQMCMLQ